MTLTPHSLLVPWSRRSRAIPVLLLWAVGPVQSLNACTRVHFTTFLPSLITSAVTDMRKGRKRLRKNFTYYILYETVKQLRVESVLQIFVFCLPFIINHFIGAGSYVGVLNSASCGTVVSYK